MLFKCNKAHNHYEGFGIVIFQVITIPPQRILKTLFAALAGMAQWIECRPANYRAASSIPSQGTCLACGPGP